MKITALWRFKFLIIFWVALLAWYAIPIKRDLVSLSAASAKLPFLGIARSYIHILQWSVWSIDYEADSVAISFGLDSRRKTPPSFVQYEGISQTATSWWWCVSRVRRFYNVACCVEMLPIRSWEDSTVRTWVTLFSILGNAACVDSPFCSFCSCFDITLTFTLITPAC